MTTFGFVFKNRPPIFIRGLLAIEPIHSAAAARALRCCQCGRALAHETT